MREVTAMRQVHPENRIAVLQGRMIDRHVGLRTGMRLNVGVLGPEYLFGAVDGQLLCYVNVTAPAIVTFVGIPFGVFIGHHRPQGFQHLGLTKFSEAIISKVKFSRSISPLMAFEISGSKSDKSDNLQFSLG